MKALNWAPSLLGAAVSVQLPSLPVTQDAPLVAGCWL
jgi:hypothetical protein